MQRNTAPLLVLILMVIGISLRLPGVPQGSPAPGNAETKRASKTESKAAAGKKTPAEELMESVYSYFGPDATELPENAHPQFLMVSVPDPVASHFSYIFDSFIESIRRVAADNGYFFDRFWLPWERPKLAQVEKAGEQEPDQSGEQTARRRSEPGMMLFRGQERLQPLIVFLIGESTRASGLNKAAFDNALRHMRKLNHGQLPGAIRLAGPTFSGSIASLKTAILSAQEQAALENHDLSFRIITGSATNAGNRQAMESGTERVSYSSVIENDQFATDRFFEYLRGKDIPLARVAVLSELDTTFGQGFGLSAEREQTRQGPLRLPFPMEISQLRNAYQQDPDLRAVWSGQTEKVPRQGLEFKLKDSGTVPDHIEPFSLDQAPLVQELQLSNTAVTLRREGIRFATIAATDILDTVFLAELIQRNCPDLRLFVVDADLLYQHSSASLSFYGMMMVTTYPLLGANQPLRNSWDPRSGLVFRSQASQGLYDAVGALLAPDDAAKTLLEYSHPTNHEARTPPLWLTVVGREGFWPVRLLADSEQSGSSLTRFPVPDYFRRGFLPRAPGLWYLIVWSLTLVYFWHFVHVTYLSWPSKHPKRVLPVYIELPKKRDAECLTYLLMGLVAMLGAYAPLTMLQYQYCSSAHCGSSGRATLVSCTVAVALLLLFMLAWIVRLGAWKGPRATAAAALLVATTVGMYWVVWRRILDPAPGHEADNLFFTFRSLFPANGVSPAFPIVLVFLGLAIWAFTHLQSMRSREVRDPALPDLEAADARLQGIRAFAERVEQFISRFPFQPRGAGTVTLACLALAAVLSQFLVPIYSLEGRAFDLLFGISARILYFLVLLEVVRFVCMWLALTGILRRVGWHAIREAFGRLAAQNAEISSQTIWQRGGQKHSNAVLAISVERLGAIAGWLQFSERQEVEDDLRKVLSWDATGTREDEKVLERLRSRLNAAANLAMQSGLGRFWMSEAPEASLKSNQEMVERVKAAEDFVALRLAAFIRYVNFQLRNRLDFISSGFLLLLIAVITYPFQPHRSLIVALSAQFLLMTVGVLFVFMQMAPGKLSPRLFISAFSRAAVPLGTLLVSQFPELGRFVLTVLDPVLRAVH